MLHDSELTACARCVYAELASWVFEGRIAKIGQRKIAQLLGFHQETVSLAILELAKRNHIRIGRDGNGKRQAYELLSPAFGQKQGKRDIIRSAPSGVPRYVSLDNEREFGKAV